MTETSILTAFSLRDTVHGGEAAMRNWRQLILLRWIAVGGQLVTILAVHYGMGIPLPLVPMLAIVAVIAVVNLASMRAVGRVPFTSAAVFAVLMFDVGALSAQLYFSGGATNPFAELFLLQVVIGVILLGSWPAWVLAALSTLLFGLLSMSYRPLDFSRFGPAEIGRLRVSGYWIAYALVAGLLVLFMDRIGRIMRARREFVSELRRRAAQEDGIVRMGLLASGAAHELGTPLASIAVILNDWRRMPKLTGDPELLAELGEMQEAVLRCKTIVTDVLQAAGEPRGEAPEAVEVRTYLMNVAEDWQSAYPNDELQTELDLADADRIIADPALRQAIWNLLQNAREASPQGVGLAARTEGDWLRIAVMDRGPGFSPEALERVGELRASTKGPGRGVGLFLVSNLVRKLGGRIEAANRTEGGGAVVTLFLPFDVIGATRNSGGRTRQ
jgi:two-component system sensor histidine kinase RegB